MPIRWADTLRMAGMLPFSLGIALFGLLQLCPPVFIGAAVLYRHKMRQLFNLPTGCMTICKDCFSYAFCTCCTIVQEARQLEMAFRVRDPAIAKVFETSGMQTQPSQNQMNNDTEPLAA